MCTYFYCRYVHKKPRPAGTSRYYHVTECDKGPSEFFGRKCDSSSKPKAIAVRDGVCFECKKDPKKWDAKTRTPLETGDLFKKVIQEGEGEKKVEEVEKAGEEKKEGVAKMQAVE